MKETKLYIEKVVIPVMPMSGKLSGLKNWDKYICSMCGCVFRVKDQHPVDHAQTCTGF